MLCVSACTVKTVSVPSGVVPGYNGLTPEAQDFGTALYDSLRDDYTLDHDHPRYDELQAVFVRLARAAGAENTPWHLYLFDQPAMVEVRAVHGNYIFVWSGFLEVAETEDELAAILACELAHTLAGHTQPVQFTAMTQILFNLAEVATSVGVMALSQGAVTIGGMGWMKYAYAELSDLDPLNRKYSEQEEQQALAIANLLLQRSGYSFQGMTRFWERVAGDTDKGDKKFLLNHGVPVEKRMAMMEKLPALPPIALVPTVADQMSKVLSEFAADTEPFFYP